MRRIGNDLPAFLACKIVEQPANAGQSHKLVAAAHHRECGRRDGGSFADRRLRNFRHPEEHFRLDSPHHQRIADQANGRGGSQLPAGQALEHNLGVARDEADCSAHEREQSLANARRQRAGRHENQPPQIRESVHCRDMDRNRAAEAFADDEQRCLRAGALEQNARGIDCVFCHAGRSGPCAARSRGAESTLIDGQSRKSPLCEFGPDFVERGRVIKCAVQQKHSGGRLARGPQPVRNLRAVGRTKRAAAQARGGIGADVCP